MTVTKAKIKDAITLDGHNANKGTVRGMKMLDDSLRKHGAGRSILLDRKGRAIAGNKTTQTAVDIGLEDVIIVKTNGQQLVAVQREDLDLDDPSTGAREMAYLDNRAGELDLAWDGLVIAADIEAGLDLSSLFDNDELAAILKAAGSELLGGKPKDAEPQIDKAKELAAKWGVESGQLWQLGRHRLICGDCTDKAVVERVMGGEKADCVFTSPPYAVGVDYASYDDTVENLRGLLPSVSKVCYDAVIEGGFAVVNFGDIAPARNVAKTEEPCEYPMALEYWPVFRADGWLLWTRRIWCKPTPRVHSPWCIQSNRAATDWEHLWTFKKPGPVILKRIDGEFSSVNGWIDTSHLHGVDEGKKVHGAGMALGIAAWMITVHSRTGKIVFEPFCGTGTTLIAAHQLTRQCRAIEIDPGYCAVTIQRWVDLTGNQPQLVNE